MPVPGKESERQPSLDERALKEVEGYIERVEKQPEVRPQQNQQNQQQTVQPNAAIAPQASVIPSQNITGQKPQIILPLDKEEVEEGLHHKVIDGVKWLAEWCVMMIKKYPGRVFYLPKPQQR